METTRKSLKWNRVDDGYTSGDWMIWDNGAGLGSSKGSGRWAVLYNGKWQVNIDTLAEAKTYAEERS